MATISAVREVDPAAANAIARSVFGRLPPDALAGILADHRDTYVPQGHLFMERGQRAPYRNGLVVSGLLRMYLVSKDGRQITIRYAAPGYFIGAATTVGGTQRRLATTGFEAVTDARALSLNQDRLRAAARADAAVAWALMDQLAQYQRDLIPLLAGAAFGSVRERTAMHLLDLATHAADGELVAPVTQQALADAVGTTRETVARALRELREAGLIATERRGILLRDPEGLVEEAERGTGVKPVPMPVAV